MVIGENPIRLWTYSFLKHAQRETPAEEANKQQEQEMAKRGPKPGTPQARHGGEAVKAKYGIEHYRHLGQIGGAAVRDSGMDYAIIGSKGGNATKARYGVEHFREAGRKGGASRRGNHKKAA